MKFRFIDQHKQITMHQGQGGDQQAGHSYPAQEVEQFAEGRRSRQQNHRPQTKGAARHQADKNPASLRLKDGQGRNAQYQRRKNQQAADQEPQGNPAQKRDAGQEHRRPGKISHLGNGHQHRGQDQR